MKVRIDRSRDGEVVSVVPATLIAVASGHNLSGERLMNLEFNLGQDEISISLSMSDSEILLQALMAAKRMGELDA